MNELLTTEDINLLNAQNATLRVENARLREELLSAQGTLLCIRAWLRGDLPEANAAQFVRLIDALAEESTDA